MLKNCVNVLFFSEILTIVRCQRQGCNRGKNDITAYSNSND